VKRAKELSPIAVRQLKDPGYYSVGGVGGLLLCVKKSGAKSWILRYSTGQKRISKNGKPYPVLRDMGLGPYPDVGLGEAREVARKKKAMLREEGLDPIEERRKVRAARKAELEKRRTFREVWEQFFKVRSGELIAKNAQHWRRSIERYAMPDIGEMVVADIETRHIEAILQPIWWEKNVTATALRGRLESVLSFATVKGYRSGDNPARWKDNLKELLPKPSKVHKVKHHRALPIDDTAEFIKALRKRTGNAAHALELAVLTAARSGEVRGALWSEFDLKRKLWTIPAERMKMDRPHAVPLSDAAMALFKAQTRDNDLVFPAPTGGQLSDMALLAVLKRMDYYDKTTVHGFRAVFKSWAQERTDTPHFISEMALAHSVGDGIQQAYQRSDLAAKRLKLMREWSRFIGYTEKGAKVVPMEARA
jgi:integrase